MLCMYTRYTLLFVKHLIGNIKCKFLIQLQLLWVKDCHDHITAGELAKSVVEAERVLEIHHERKVSFIHKYTDSCSSSYIVHCRLDHHHRHVQTVQSPGRPM